MLMKRNRTTVGWLHVEQNQPNRPTLKELYVNRKIITNVGHSTKLVEIHDAENKYIVPVIRISLFSTTFSEEAINEAFKALELLERVISLFGCEEAENDLIEVVNKWSQTRDLIKIPAKKGAGGTQQKEEKAQDTPSLPF